MPAEYDNVHLIGFFSPVHIPSKRRCSVTEHEALALVWSVQHLYFNVWVRQFTILTEYQSRSETQEKKGKCHRGLRFAPSNIRVLICRRRHCGAGVRAQW